MTDLKKILRAFAFSLAGLVMSITAAAEDAPLVYDLDDNCRAGRHNIPHSDFAVDVYCDDALGVNIAIALTRFSAPVSGPYSLGKRMWQGGDWTRYVTSIAASKSGKFFVTTDGRNGTGKIYALDLAAQNAKEIWSLKDGDCAPTISAVDGAKLSLKIFLCDGCEPRYDVLMLKS